ncbi:HNH endonuclease, partial [Candidatus Poribacteria bacterium]|nr:HNH endonuclease [Candidatus Poribacteria bacterium]
MAKVRIPNDLAADVMFASDSTCCVCEERGKAVQIHHIDENPSNNVFENLSVLCLECHNKTQLKGGFDRKLNSDLIIKYRNQWINRVRSRRKIADERAIRKHVGEQSLSQQVEQPNNRLREDAVLKEPSIVYINSLPEFKSALLAQAQPKRDTGVTSTMVQASH